MPATDARGLAGWMIAVDTRVLSLAARRSDAVDYVVAPILHAARVSLRLNPPPMLRTTDHVVNDAVALDGTKTAWATFGILYVLAMGIPHAIALKHRSAAPASL